MRYITRRTALPNAYLEQDIVFLSSHVFDHMRQKRSIGMDGVIHRASHVDIVILDQVVMFLRNSSNKGFDRRLGFVAVHFVKKS